MEKYLDLFVCSQRFRRHSGKHSPWKICFKGCLARTLHSTLLSLQESGHPTHEYANINVCFSNFFFTFIDFFFSPPHTAVPPPRGGEESAQPRNHRPQQPPHGGKDHHQQTPRGQRECRELHGGLRAPHRIEAKTLLGGIRLELRTSPRYISTAALQI